MPDRWGEQSEGGGGNASDVIVDDSAYNVLTGPTAQNVFDELDGIVSAPTPYPARIGAKVALPGGFAIPNANQDTLLNTWTASGPEYGGDVHSAANPQRLTAPVDGVYECHLVTLMALGAGTTNVSGKLSLEGNPGGVYYKWYRPLSGPDVSLELWARFGFTAGQFVQAYAQLSSATRTVQADAGASYMEMWKVAELL